jgi:hypothetical protein
VLFISDLQRAILEPGSDACPVLVPFAGIAPRALVGADVVAGDGFLALLSAGDNQPLEALILDDAGVPRGAPQVLFNGTEAELNDAAVVYDGTRYFVFFHDGVALRLHRISPDGTIEAERIVEEVARDVEGIDAAFDGDDIVLAMSAFKPGFSGDADVHVTRVDREGALLSPFEAVTDGPGAETLPHLATTSPTRLLLAYSVDHAEGLLSHRSVEVIVLGVARELGESCRIDADCATETCEDAVCVPPPPPPPPADGDPAGTGESGLLDGGAVGCASCDATGADASPLALAVLLAFRRRRKCASDDTDAVSS